MFGTDNMNNNVLSAKIIVENLIILFLLDIVIKYHKSYLYCNPTEANIKIR